MSNQLRQTQTPDFPSTPSIASIMARREEERLRQEKAAFDQALSHNLPWNHLRLVMGYCTILIMMAILIICGSIIWYSNNFSQYVVGAAVTGLLGDILALAVGIWKIVLNPESMKGPHPTIEVDMSVFSSDVFAEIKAKNPEV